MRITRAIIVATSTTHDRPWSSAGSGPRQLLPVATKPILFHTFEELAAAGVTAVALVTEPQNAAAFEAAVGGGKRWGMAISCAPSDADTGVQAALAAAGDFVDGEPMLVQRADAILREDLRENIASFSSENLDALALVLAPTHEQLPRIAGRYLLGPAAVAIVLERPVPTDPLERLRRRGSQVRVAGAEGCLACHGSESSLLQANRHALAMITTDVGGASLEDCEIQGAVVVHPRASLRNTLVRGPAIIGADSWIADSYIGPYTSIGEHARIEGTEIEHAIVMDGAQLLHVGSRLETSVIGRGAKIARRFDMPRAVRLSIGDGAQIGLS